MVLPIPCGFAILADLVATSARQRIHDTCVQLASCCLELLEFVGYNRY
jgi:hypothetical protein